MPSDHENQRFTESIRARAGELDAQGEPLKHAADAEVLAALADGTLSFEDIDDETLNRCLKELGADQVIQAITQETGPVGVSEQEKSKKKIDESSRVATIQKLPVASIPRHEMPGSQSASDQIAASPTREMLARREISWWRANSGWIAVAASIACVTTVFIWTGKNVQDAPRDPLGGLAITFQWSQNPPFDSGTLKPWGAPSPSIAKGLPDFDRGGGTLGAGGEDLFTSWRLATVIMRVEGGQGSGAFISADGWLLTNYHIVQGAVQAAALSGEAPTVEVIAGRNVDGHIRPRPPVRAKVYRVDPIHDLALLKLEALPGGMKTVPFLKLAEMIRESEDCFVIGNQEGGPAWWVRSGNIASMFDFPGEQSEQASGAMNLKNVNPDAERRRLRIVQSDTRVTPGDIGGPLLNEKGQLIGLTMAGPSEVQKHSGGWHIGLGQIREFMSELPNAPEPAPFDVWTAGFGGVREANISIPIIKDGDQDGRDDTVVVPYFSQAKDGSGHVTSGLVAYSLFVNFSDRPMPVGVKAGPKGLWGRADKNHGFAYDMFVTERIDGVTAVGYVNRNGMVDEIRIGAKDEKNPSTVWSLTNEGNWKATKPAGVIPYVDPARINDDNRRRFATIYSNLTGEAESKAKAETSAQGR